ncbi:MAG: DegT/DnrJ/EryC1/StrS aminotransferase family protein [Bacteroidales bacterium]|nr:DegT/DnrJ/EryC1/StrS aminotransferase family protein [Bacteroidales bacterium]
MNLEDKKLAINGGEPVTKNFIIIHKPEITREDIQKVTESIQSTFVSGDGPDCRKFEEKLKEYLGVKHAFFTNSCTGALDLAYMVRDFPAGSEVIVPNFTYTSTALAPLLNNLKVVLVDVNAYDGNIDIKKIEEAITDKTVAISPVDYAGNPAEMGEILAIAKKHKLYVVHDTAQSLGAIYKGKKSGVLADVCCFSFHGTKNITTGEGGALITNNDEIAAKVKIARDKGTDKYAFIDDPQKKGFYEYVSLGNSYVQSNILGALGISQLAKIDTITARRKEIAAYYTRELKNISSLKLPTPTKNGETNWHLYYLLVPPKHKFWIIDALKAEGVASNVHYNPLHLNAYYKELGEGKDLRNSVEFYSQLIRIPIYPSLSDKEIENIATAVKKVMGAITI